MLPDQKVQPSGPVDPAPVGQPSPAPEGQSILTSKEVASSKATTRPIGKPARRGRPPRSVSRLRKVRPLPRQVVSAGSVADQPETVQSAVVRPDLTPEAMASADLITEGDLANLFDTIFDTAAGILGPHWKLKPGDAARLGKAWKPIVDHYMPSEPSLTLKWTVAAGSLVGQIGTRVAITVQQRRARQTVKA